jgi:hypothetical protein
MAAIKVKEVCVVAYYTSHLVHLELPKVGLVSNRAATPEYEVMCNYMRALTSTTDKLADSMEGNNN